MFFRHIFMKGSAQSRYRKKQKGGLCPMKKEHIRDPMPEKPAGAAAKRRWVRLTAAAACLVLVAAGILLLLPLHSGIRLVSRYPSASDGAYRVPNAGETLFESAVREARTHYSGKRAAFLRSPSMRTESPCPANRKRRNISAFLPKVTRFLRQSAGPIRERAKSGISQSLPARSQRRSCRFSRQTRDTDISSILQKTATAPASPCPGKIASPRSRRTAPERRLRLPYANRILPAKIDHLPTNPRQNRTLPL